MMQTLYALCAVTLLAQLVAGLFVTFRSPRRADKMLAAQLMATMSAALVVLLGGMLDLPVLVDVSLVFALLASVSTVAFVRQGWATGEDAS